MISENEKCRNKPTMAGVPLASRRSGLNRGDRQKKHVVIAG